MGYNLGRAVVLVAFTSLFSHLWHGLIDYYRFLMAFIVPITPRLDHLSIQF